LFAIRALPIIINKFIWPYLIVGNKYIKTYFSMRGRKKIGNQQPPLPPSLLPLPPSLSPPPLLLSPPLPLM
jgi:hypothetical protein